MIEYWYKLFSDMHGPEAILWRQETFERWLKSHLSRGGQVTKETLREAMEEEKKDLHVRMFG